MFELSPFPIERNALIERLGNHQAGALVVFEGWVRDHNQGKKVSSLEYQVYEALAKKEGIKILEEARRKFNLHAVHCVHRHGHLSLGESAVWIGATATHRDDAFRATRYVIDEIKLRLPIWKKEHYVEENPEWVFCKDHHTHVHFHESDYYEKQSKIVEQAKLKSAKVLVVGAGGLGCPVLTSLTTAGVGEIQIVDADTVNLSNLHRQPLFSPESVGEKKAPLAARALSRMNPFVHVQGHDLFVSSLNVEALIEGKDLILDCTDNLETKYLLHDACLRKRIPLITASIYQFEGQIRTLIPGGGAGCLRCLNDVTPDDSRLGNCNDFGVLGSAVSTIGNIQANEAILFLLSGKNNTTTSSFFMNLRTLTQMKIRNGVKEDCQSCAGKIEFPSHDLEVTAADAKNLDAVIVDVRESGDDILLDHLESSRPVVVCCHKGVRSKKLVMAMREKGHEHFYSLKGGACSL